MLPEFTTTDLKKLLDDYDAIKGKYRRALGDQGDVVNLRDFYEHLSDNQKNRDLDEKEVFKLSGIIIAAATVSGSASDTLFKELKIKFSEPLLQGLVLLHKYNHLMSQKHQTFTFAFFKDLIDCEDETTIVTTATNIVATQLLINSGLTKDKILELRDTVLASTDPVKLALALSTIAVPGYKFFNEENIQTVLDSSDPMGCANDLVYAETNPGFKPENPGIVPALSKLVTLNWSSMWNARNEQAQNAQQLALNEMEKDGYTWFTHKTAP
jgi:hypothetical protein